MDARARVPARCGPRSASRPGPGAPELRRCASRSCSTVRCRRTTRRRRAARRRGRGSCAAARPSGAGAARRGERSRCSRRGRRGVIVAGRDERGATAAASSRRSPPRRAARCSPTRSPERAAAPAAVAHYDALLRDAAFAAAHAPDLVVRAGDLPTSKPLRAWLAGARRARRSPSTPRASGRTRPRSSPSRSLGRAGSALDARPARARPPARPAWLDGWRAADAARRRRDRRDARPRRRASRRVAAALGRAARRATVFTASSMPVRDVETFWPARDDPPRVLAHRGANGIDGTVAAAFGAAAAGDGPVVLHIGDVALVHDLGALCPPRGSASRSTIVLVDNGGGGIFDFLPVADPDRRLRGARRDADGPRLRARRRAVRPRVRTPGTMAEVRAALEAAIAAAGTTLIHVRTDRADNVALHRRCGPRWPPPSGPRSSVARMEQTSLLPDPPPSGPRPAAHVEGDREGRHRRGRPQGAAVPRGRHGDRAARERPLRARSAPARLAHQLPPRDGPRGRDGVSPRSVVVRGRVRASPRRSLAPPGKDADLQESLQGFSRVEDTARR